MCHLYFCDSSSHGQQHAELLRRLEPFNPAANQLWVARSHWRLRCRTRRVGLPRARRWHCILYVVLGKGLDYAIHGVEVIWDSGAKVPRAIARLLGGAPHQEMAVPLTRQQAFFFLYVQRPGHSASQPCAVDRPQRLRHNRHMDRAHWVRIAF